MYRHEPQGLIWICVQIFFFALKVSVPIDRHYMTDRLQRFELKILFVFYWRNKVTYILDALG